MVEERDALIYKSRADQVYAAIQNVRIDETVPYCALNESAGCSIENNRSPLYSAIRRLEKEKRRTLKNVPTVGYRCIQAEEHEDLARSYHRGARRKLRRSREVVEAADRTLLTPEQVKRFDAMERTLCTQQSAIRRLEERQERQEKTLRLVSQKTSTHTTSITSLEQRLAELEQRVEKKAA